MEIAYDLAEGGAAKVWLSVRTPPNIVLREGPAGFPGDHIASRATALPGALRRRVHGLRATDGPRGPERVGLPIPEEGVFARRRLGVAPSIVDKEVIEAIKTGRIEVVSGVESLDSTSVGLADGARVEPDA